MKKFIFRMLAGIVLLNMTVVVGALVARRRLPTYGDQDSDTFALVAAMDGVDFASRADALAAGSGTAVAGGIEIEGDAQLTTGVTDSEAAGEKIAFVIACVGELVGEAAA